MQYITKYWSPVTYKLNNNIFNSTQHGEPLGLVRLELPFRLFSQKDRSLATGPQSADS